jgi:hypothetical protein
VSAGSKERFLHFGQQALIWNDETLKQKAAAKAAALKEVEAMAASTAEKAASFMSPGSGGLNAMFGVIDEETIETIDA